MVAISRWLSRLAEYAPRLISTFSISTSPSPRLDLLHPARPFRRRAVSVNRLSVPGRMPAHCPKKNSPWCITRLGLAPALIALPAGTVLLLAPSQTRMPRRLERTQLDSFAATYSDLRLVTSPPCLVPPKRIAHPSSPKPSGQRPSTPVPVLPAAHLLCRLAAPLSERGERRTPCEK